MSYKIKFYTYKLYTGIRHVENPIFNISMNESARVSWSFVSNDVIVLLYQVTITNDTSNTVIEYMTIEHEYEVSIDIYIGSL